MKKEHAPSNYTDLIDAIYKTSSRDQAQALIFDVLSKAERNDISQRLKVARLLNKGFNYDEVKEATHASSATISRVSKALNGGSGWYRWFCNSHHRGA